jgi:hypothetical protein
MKINWLASKVNMKKSAMKLLYTNFRDTLVFYTLKFIVTLVRKYDMLIWKSLWWYQNHIVQSVPADNTEERDSFFNALDFYSGDSPFGFRLGHFFILTEVSCGFSLSSLDKVRSRTLKAHLPHIFPSLFTVCTIARRFKYRAAVCGSVNYKVGT